MDSPQGQLLRPRETGLHQALDDPAQLFKRGAQNWEAVFRGFR